MPRHFIAGFSLAIVAAMTGVPNDAFAQSVDRCEGARAILGDSGLSAEEIGYFKKILQSAECTRQKAKAATPAPQAPVAAQPKKAAMILPEGPFSAAQCDASVTKLAQLQEARQSETIEGKREFAIWSSSDCSSRRKKGAMNVSPDIQHMAARLKADNIDLDQRTELERQKCSLLTDEGKKGSCLLNSRLVAYSKAINEVNANSRNAYQSGVRDYQSKLADVERIKRERLAKIEADKAAYNESIRKWREGVALCKKGKREYCAK
ncbi:MAG: hypothetical protein COA41_03655 [Sphingopyxis sp.]|nr:MAG: hypothetical protein COA41_03655 [Sphingopyxis sp.]